MTGVLNLDDVLALLEERPMPTVELAGYLDMPSDTVHQALLLCEREGRLKRIGTRQDWARPDVVVRPGRKPYVDRDAVRAEIRVALTGRALSAIALWRVLGYGRRVVTEECAAMAAVGELVKTGIGMKARYHLAGTEVALPSDPKTRVLELLATGPMRTAALTQAIGLQATSSLLEHLRALERAGKVQRLGTNWQTSWALPGYVSPAPPEDDEPGDPDDPNEALDQVLELDGLPPAPTRVTQRSENPRLRQPHERPASKVVTKDESWWLKPQTREEFQAAAALRNTEMSAKSAHWRSQSIKGIGMHE